MSNILVDHTCTTTSVWYDGMPVITTATDTNEIEATWQSVYQPADQSKPWNQNVIHTVLKQPHWKPQKLNQMKIKASSFHSSYKGKLTSYQLKSRSSISRSEYQVFRLEFWVSRICWVLSFENPERACIFSWFKHYTNLPTWTEITALDVW